MLWSPPTALQLQALMRSISFAFKRLPLKANAFFLDGSRVNIMPHSKGETNNNATEWQRRSKIFSYCVAHILLIAWAAQNEAAHNGFIQRHS
jgi:hypothetical protein